MNKLLRSHRYFLLFYGGIFVSFLWPLLIFQKTFIFGDYWQQHYPWAYEYSRALKAETLPYWVPNMACGFPLVAEGQVGAYYLSNIILFGVLPFSVAYTLSILMHVIFGGVGFYAYGLKIKFSKEAAALTAVLFSFSSAYGGCFSNTAALRVLAWLPWSLLTYEYFKSTQGKNKLFLITILGAIFSQMWMAGAAQMALYAMGYLFCLWMIQSKGRVFFDFLVVQAVGICLSLPQWAATLELVRLSVRSGETAAFALWGSVPPPAVISLIYPKWGIFLGVSFYLGTLPAALLLISLLSKKEVLEKIHWGLALFFLLLAFGKYDPLYAFLVKGCSLTMLRNPSKFLFFSTVSLAVATGFAYDRLTIATETERVLQRLKKGLFALLAGVVVIPFLLQTLTEFFRNPIFSFVHRMAEQAFYQKKDPIYDLSYYDAKADEIFARFEKLFHYSNPWTLWAIALFLLSVLVILRCFQKDSGSFWRRGVFPVVLSTDLLIFGSLLGTGFIGNIRNFPEKLPQALEQTMRISQAADSSTVIEWARVPGDSMLLPNANLLYAISHVGGYSPLLVSRYYELTKELGVSDCSLGLYPVVEDTWRKEFGLIEALGVGQILSNEKLSLPGLKLVRVMNHSHFINHRRFEDSRYLYGVNQVLPYVYAVYDWKEISEAGNRLAYLKSHEFKPFKEAVLEKMPAGFISSPDLPLSKADIISKKNLDLTAQIKVVSDAVLVFRNVYYPRWKLEVDGNLERLMPVNHAISGVLLKKGFHRVRFFYDARWNHVWEGVAAVCWILLVCGNILVWKLYEKK